MVGGLLLSQLLTLFTTPVVYIYLDRINHWLIHLKRSAEQSSSRCGRTKGGMKIL